MIFLVRVITLLGRRGKTIYPIKTLYLIYKNLIYKNDIPYKIPHLLYWGSVVLESWTNLGGQGGTLWSRRRLGRAGCNQQLTTTVCQSTQKPSALRSGHDGEWLQCSVSWPHRGRLLGSWLCKVDVSWQVSGLCSCCPAGWWAALGCSGKAACPVLDLILPCTGVSGVSWSSVNTDTRASQLPPDDGCWLLQPLGALEQTWLISLT